MKNLKYLALSGLAVAALVATAPFFADNPAKPLKNPARIEIDVSPDPVAAGGSAEVTVRIRPIDGVKVNRYPKIKLEVPAREGLVAEARTEIGNDTPPPPDKMDTNYFKSVDPLELTLAVDADAPGGRHAVEAKLTYFYCVLASGFCAPHRTSISIPVAVE